MKRRLAALSLALAVTAGAALPCAFHGMLPQETLADRILAADTLVLARPDPADPLRFHAVESLRGAKPEATLPFVVGMDERRRMAGNRDASVLFARLDAYGPWERLARIDADNAAVVRQIVALSETWLYEGDAPRAKFFADLLGSDHAGLIRLALRELDRLPYGLLRTLELPVGAERLIAGMDLVEEPGLLPIRALLLGLSGSPDAGPALRHWIEASAGPAIMPRLGALSLALVEAEGAAGLATLQDGVLSDPAVSAASIEYVVEALAIHLTEGRRDLAPGIAAALDGLVATRPDTAPGIARQLGGRGIWSQVPALTAALQGGSIRNAADLIAVSSYIQLAKQAAGDSAGPDLTEVSQ